MRIEALLPAMASRHGSPSSDVHDEMRSSAAEVANVMRALVACSGYALSAWDAVSGTHRHVTLASEGYDDDVQRHMNDAFIDSNPAFRILHTKTSSALRWVDLARDWNLTFAETVSAQEFLIPAGFHEGTTMCLRLLDGRYTGSLHMSWSSPGDATDECRELIERFRPLLAIVCDMLRSVQVGVERLPSDAHALLMSREGEVTEVPGRSAGPLLSEGGPVRGMLPRYARLPATRRYLWPDVEGRCHRVEITPCRGGITLITERTVPWPHGLTVREAQILHLIAGGLSNPQIGKRLYISPRTVSTHVEHILDKLGCLTRAQLAAVAVDGDLLLMGEP
ncbi:helix-turn-helix transcriptional regulator [Actinomadura madurae]|uniref:Regulatory protein, luxR family n=2 Tax=Actinomadura madurae TaxID=1993 RepID=A0A1I5KQE3_9ACTN|nr:regulatory protein, luxR family [Actinomadura madurae]